MHGNKKIIIKVSIREKCNSVHSTTQVAYDIQSTHTPQKAGLTILVARAHRRYYEKPYVNYNYIYVDVQKAIFYTILMHS